MCGSLFPAFLTAKICLFWLPYSIFLKKILLLDFLFYYFVNKFPVYSDPLCYFGTFEYKRNLKIWITLISYHKEMRSKFQETTWEMISDIVMTFENILTSVWRQCRFMRANSVMGNNLKSLDVLSTPTLTLKHHESFPIT